MTVYSPYRKGTVLAPVGGSKHLHIICNDPVYHPVHGCECVLVVNITTVYPAPVHHDPACILRAGEHPFVHHDSYVFYADAIVWKVPNVVSREESGELEKHADMEESVFQRVLSGFESSDFTPNKVLKFYRQHCK
ncbi:MAG: hypothetical protein E6Z83_21825 [Pantoea sp.]|uniref:hypothetical protein n=1 Tax=Pantoea TaxID=53335 RepID=UPI000907947A|nr:MULTISPECIES: hypothetical protein [Pantoea]MDU6089779.1 hypothetical protein [Staphylococcus lugdunensis]MDU1573233.1 hypothetical protein [Pantoea sp.]MDU5476145.1 hypothetical protein [Pantoea sp.]MDU5783409.1 hypothetical protein [Pantoea sp.]PNK64581.1 hypothetical protein A6J33_018220 [Pantoea sp. FDAARGOS_194]